MEQLLQAERLALLDCLAESKDPEERDTSRAVALFIKHLLGPVKDYVISLDESNRNPVPAGDPDFMDFDSDADPARPSSSGGVPAGAQSQ